MATFEVKSVKDGKSCVRYYTLEVYEGITADIYDKMEKLGHTDISIRMI